VLLAAVVAAAVGAGAVYALAPTDPQAGHEAYAAVRLPEAWDTTTGSPGVVVAIVDSGVDPAHPDLAGAVRAGYDFVDRDADTSELPNGGHGTAVAGVAAARANNGVGGVGSCFGCDVMPLRVLGPGGFALNTDTAAAIDYAVDHGAAVVNTSIYGERSPERLRAAMERARAAGVLVVAAAGNEASTTPQFPAAFPDALSVAATSANGTLASFSSRGPWVKLAAPACAPVTVLGGTTTVACGTSVSSPLVAGIVALLRTQAPFASADEIEEALANTARPVTGTRFGLVDAAAALESLGSPGPRLRPEIVGSPVAGEPLEALSGVWPGTGLAVTYRWQRCRAACVPVAGATGARLTPTAADAGARFRVEASAPGVETALSEPSGRVEVRPRLLERPSIRGQARVGKRLAARTGRWAGTSLRLRKSWLRCGRTCTAVGSAATYRVRARDRGARLVLEVVASNRLGAVTARSRSSSVVR
jgi:Subtilase family